MPRTNREKEQKRRIIAENSSLHGKVQWEEAVFRMLYKRQVKYAVNVVLTERTCSFENERSSASFSCVLINRSELENATDDQFVFEGRIEYENESCRGTTKEKYIRSWRIAHIRMLDSRRAHLFLCLHGSNHACVRFSSWISTLWRIHRGISKKTFLLHETSAHNVSWSSSFRGSLLELILSSASMCWLTWIHQG